MPTKATPRHLRHQPQMACSHTDGITDSAAEGEAAEEIEEKESCTTVHCTHCTIDNDTTAECGQLTGNQGATPRATPGLDEDMLLRRRPGTSGTNAPHISETSKPTASRAATAPERRRTRTPKG